MTLEVIGLIVIAVLLLLVYQAWRENKQLDRSWNKMHDLFLRQIGDIYQDAWTPLKVKTFYSNQLLNRLIPSLNNASSSDNDYYHSLIYPIQQ